MRILLLGSQGLLGWELQQTLAPLGALLPVGHRPKVSSSEAVATTPWSTDQLGADLTDAVALRALVWATRPQVIVNAAGFSAVDAAEQNPQAARAAWAVNAVAPGVLAQAAEAAGAALLHFSTDYVFSGAGHTPQAEEAATGPLSAYGRSKLEGETRVRAQASRHLIFRTSWLYSARRPNFMGAILKRAVAQDTMAVVADQVGAPTSAAWLASVVAQVLPLWSAAPAWSGLVHTSAAGAVSRLAWAQVVLTAAARAGWPLRAQAHSLRGISSAEHAAQHPGTAPRPLNSRLDCTRLRHTFGITAPSWQTGVDQALAQLLKENPPR
jgi:dTDP-4-dehydrorhamnose reductase